MPINIKPFGELFISQRNTSFDSRYKFTMNRYCNTKTLRFHSVLNSFGSERVENGKHTFDLDIGDFGWTIENIRATDTHEILSHRIKKFGDGTKTHYRCYFAEIDNKYWEGTTPRFKTHALQTMWECYSKEVGYKPLPLKYDIEYRKHIK